MACTPPTSTDDTAPATVPETTCHTAVEAAQEAGTEGYSPNGAHPDTPLSDTPVPDTPLPDTGAADAPEIETAQSHLPHPDGLCADTTRTYLEISSPENCSWALEFVLSQCEPCPKFPDPWHRIPATDDCRQTVVQPAEFLRMLREYFSLPVLRAAHLVVGPDHAPELHPWLQSVGGLLFAVRHPINREVVDLWTPRGLLSGLRSSERHGDGEPDLSNAGRSGRPDWAGAARLRTRTSRGGSRHAAPGPPVSGALPVAPGSPGLGGAGPPGLDLTRGPVPRQPDLQTAVSPRFAAGRPLSGQPSRASSAGRGRIEQTASRP